MGGKQSDSEQHPGNMIVQSHTSFFRYIAGQDQIVKTLQRSLGSERIAHAYLFHGPRGLGKTSMALAMARAVNCDQRWDDPTTVDGCGQCDACRRFDTGNYPDFHLVEPVSSSITIDQVRQVKSILSFRSYTSRFKVCILLNCETMRLEAANSLLKVLEEPPRDSILILVSERLQAIPATVISRCQVMRFSPVPEEEIVRLLVSKQGMDQQAARVVAGPADGRPGWALNAEDQGLLQERDMVINCLIDLKNRSRSDLLSLAEEWGKSENPAGLVDVIISWFRDVLILRGTGKADLLINADRYGEIADAARTYTRESLENIISMLQEEIRMLEGSANIRLCLDVLLLRLKEEVS